MESITSKRHFIKFYLAVLGATLFFVVMALLMFLLHDKAISSWGGFVLIGVSALLIFLCIYFVYRYFQNAPTIQADLISISFNGSETYFWKDLEKFELTGKRPFKTLFTNWREGALFKFKDQQEKYLIDDMYHNSPELKKFIQKIVEKIDPSDSCMDSTEATPFADDNFIYYKGYQLLCFEGIFVWSFTAPIIFLIIKMVLTGGKIATMIAPTIFLIFFSAIFYNRLFYFGISNNQLVVRMHNVFWYRKIYRLNAIREVVFETHDKMPTCLRIITKDFESKLYPAGSIWSKRWMEFKKDLENKNIKVRNECVSYEPFRFKLYQ